MSDIGLTFDDIDGAADKLDQGKEEMSSLLTELNSLSQELSDSGFKSEAGRAFSTAYAELSDSLEKALEDIPAMALALRQMKSSFEDLDGAMASS